LSQKKKTGRFFPFVFTLLMQICYTKDKESTRKGPTVFNILEKVHFTPQLLGVDYLTPSTMKQSILPLNFSKPVKLPLNDFETADCYSNRETAYSTPELSKIGQITPGGFETADLLQ
jgi:hypothetical protein